jgi:site-specific DNA-methyltransferase (adenine-specific)
MHEGQVLDGRNRLMACQQAGVPPRFTQWQGEGSPLQWAISANIRRRHLSPSQRAILALDLLPLLERDAKARQQLSRGRGRKAPTTAAVGAVRGKASQIAARLAATNSAYVERAKRLRAECPDIIEAVRFGGVTLAEATRLSRFPPDVRARAVHVRLVEPNRTIIDAIRTALAASPPARPASKRRRGSVRIWCGDCLSLLRTSVEDASVDVVCTSPPYNVGVRYGTYDDQRPTTAFSDWLDEVFRELRRVLKPTGSLFLVAGHAARHPWAAFDIARVAAAHFELQNQIAWVKSIAVDGRTRGHYRPIASGRHLNRTWEHLLHFSIDGRAALDKAAIGVPHGDDRGQARHGNASGTHCPGDAWFIPHATVQSAVHRGGHPATFPVTLAERCLRLVGCGRGALVLDPFCGVNGIAAVALVGARGIGIDVDESYCRHAAAACGTTVEHRPRRPR